MALNKEELFVLDILHDIDSLFKRYEKLTGKKENYQLAVSRDGTIILNGVKATRQCFGQTIHSKDHVVQYFIKNLFNVKSYIERILFGEMFLSQEFDYSKMTSFQDALSAVYSMAEQLETDVNQKFIISSENISFGELGQSPCAIIPWFNEGDSENENRMKEVREGDPSIFASIYYLIKVVEKEIPQPGKIREAKEQEVIEAVHEIEMVIKAIMKNMTPKQLDVLTASLHNVVSKDKTFEKAVDGLDSCIFGTKAKVVGSNGTYDQPYEGCPPEDDE